MTVSKSAARKSKRERLRAWLSLPPMVTRERAERWGCFRVETHRPFERSVHDDRYAARRWSR